MGQQPQQPQNLLGPNQSQALRQLLVSPFAADTLMRVLAVNPTVRSGQLPAELSGEFKIADDEAIISDSDAYADELPQTLTHELGHSADFRGDDTEVRAFFDNMYRLQQTLGARSTDHWALKQPPHEYAAQALERAMMHVREPKQQSLEQLETEYPGTAMAVAFIQRRLNAPKAKP